MLQVDMFLKNVEAIISDGAYTSPYDIIGYRLEADYKISKYPAISIIARHIKKLCILI